MNTDVLYLNFDDSVDPSPVIETMDLRSMQEPVRYWLSRRTMRTLQCRCADAIGRHRIFLTGSGDFHHLAYLLLSPMAMQGLHVVVFDNHPDNMYIPAGIHCASWVYHAARLPQVKRVSVIGITSGDVEGINIIQNRYAFLRSGKVRYYCRREIPRLARMLAGAGIHNLAPAQDSTVSVLKSIIIPDEPIYLSIDKDVLSPAVVRTFWDQGCMTERELAECIAMMAPNIIAADICGDLSSYRFHNPFKRLLRRLDGIDAPVEDPAGERNRHRDLNQRLIAAIHVSLRPDR